MNEPLDFPFVAKNHILTLATLTKEEAGCWVTLVAHCWASGPIASDIVVRLIGEEQFEQLRFLLDMDKGKFSFKWLEEARARKEKRSMQNSENGKKGGRGNKRGNKGQRSLPPIEAPRTPPPPVPPRPPRAPRSPQAEKVLVLFPQEKFTWPQWAGEQVRAKWQDFKRARWEKHKEQYLSIESEQSSIDLLGVWFNNPKGNGAACFKLLQVATAKQWKNLVSPEDLAKSSYGIKGPVSDAPPQKGEIDKSKTKSWLL